MIQIPIESQLRLQVRVASLTMSRMFGGREQRREAALRVEAIGYLLRGEGMRWDAPREVEKYFAEEARDAGIRHL